MQEWKKEIVAELEKEATSKREISLMEVGKKMGYKHIKSRDCLDILRCFVKNNPTYRIVKMCTKENWRYASLWCTGVLTELQYD